MHMAVDMVDSCLRLFKARSLMKGQEKTMMVVYEGLYSIFNFLII